MKPKLHICLGPFKTGTTWIWENLKEDSRYSTFNNLKEPFLWTTNLPPNRTSIYTREEWFNFAEKTEKILLDFSQGYEEIIQHPNNVLNLISKFDIKFFVILRDPIDIFVSSCNFTGKPIITSTTTPEIAKQRLNQLHIVKYSKWLPVWKNNCNVTCIDFKKINNPDYMNEKFETDLPWNKKVIGKSGVKFNVRSQWSQVLENYMSEYFYDEVEIVRQLINE